MPRSTISQGEDRPALTALTGLRGFAALAVVVANSLRYMPAVSNGPVLWWYTEGRGLLEICLATFFVLSGFLVHYNYGHIITGVRSLSALKFILARLARLYPLYAVVILVVLSQGGPMHTSSLPFYLTLTQSWFYFFWHGHPLLFQVQSETALITWALSSLWFCYLSYPLFLLPFLCRARTGSAVTMTLVASGLIFVLCLLLNWHRGAIDSFTFNGVGGQGSVEAVAQRGQDLVRWLVDYSPYARFVQFSVGAVSAAVYLQVRERKGTPDGPARRLMHPPPSVLTLLLVIEFVIASPKGALLPARVLEDIRSSSVPLLAVPVAAVILYIGSHPSGRLARLLSSPYAILVGDVSYPVYLLQFVIIGSFATVFIGDGPSYWGHVLSICMRIGVALAQVVGLAAVVHLLIEEPARRWLAHRFHVSAHRVATPAWASLLRVVDDRPSRSRSRG